MTTWWAWTKNEAIFVTGVMVVIVGICVVQLNIGALKTRDVQRRADIDLVGRALNSYLLAVGMLPPATSDGQIMACGDQGLDLCPWGGQLTMQDIDGLVYLRNFPTDPKAAQGRTYVYTVDQERTKYKVYAALEYKSDPVLKPGLTLGCGGGVQCNWYVGN